MRPLAAILAGRRKKLPLSLYWSAYTHCPNDVWTQPRKCTPQSNGRRRAMPTGNRGVPLWGIIRSAWCFPACWGIPLCQGFAIPKGPAPAHTACCACLPGETLHGETGAFSRARGLSALRGIFRRVGVSPFAEGSPSRRAPPQPALYVVSAVPARRSMGKPGHSLVRGLSALRGISRRVGYPLLPRVHPPKRLRRSPRCISHLPSRRDAAQIRLHRHIKRGGGCHPGAPRLQES